MVCSACGFENPATMRFCGMCGTPLPHRPITAPGAHSTLSFTRTPEDTFAAREHGAASQGGGVALERFPESKRDFEAARSNEATAERSLGATTPAVEDQVQSAATELVPDVPLDEYVQKFRYEPPRDAAEFTMRGDEPVAASPSPETLPANPDVSSASSAVTTISDDVDRRLGLEPETAAETRVARPRFLDINEPPKPGKPERKETRLAETATAETGAAAISGPSFLGLSDSPQNWADSIGVEQGEYAPRRSHWRAWTAIGILLLFGWLGWLQYRSQVQQSNNGPIELIRAKLHNWRQAAMALIDKNLTPPPLNTPQPEPKAESKASASPPKPETATQGTQAPDGQAPAEAPNQAGTQGQQPAAPPNSQTASASNPEQPKSADNKPPVADTTTSKATAGNPSPTGDAEKPKAKVPGSNAAQPPAARQTVLGADEMTKAADASDSAAAAAWLWKATAKGNPEAPVMLANMYVQGNGVPRSCEQALVLLKTAAQKENAVARNRLGSMYANGTCVPLSRVEAYHWYSASLTANPNSQWTRQTRDALWQDMTADERAQAQRYR